MTTKTTTNATKAVKAVVVKGTKKQNPEMVCKPIFGM